MKKYFVVLCALFLLMGCDNKSDEEQVKNNSESNSNIEVKESHSNSNEISNEKSNSNTNIISNVTSKIVSNKTSTVISNKISNKESTITSNKSNLVSQKVSNIVKDKTGTTSKGYKIEKNNGVYYINGILVVNKTYDLPSTYNPGGLLTEFSTAFNKLKSAAANDGIKIWIQSGFRSYNTQVNLYNRYVARDGKAAADRYSARAGHSEHQTGLAADLNEISDTFGETKAGKWLSDNCWKYGFILRFPKGKESETGYMYESWHFRYLGDVELAKKLYNNGNWLTLESYLGIDSKYGD